MKHLSKLYLASLFLFSTQAWSADAWFIIKTDTPELTMNQSMPSTPLLFSFNITNNIGQDSGLITISDLPKGVTLNNITGTGMCVVQSYDPSKNKITISNLHDGQTCEINLMVADQSLLGSTHVVVDPKVCAKDNTRCSKPVNADDRINIYVINDFQKIVFITFENENATAALSYSMFATIAEQGAYFDNFHAVTRPSQPNYLSMIAGDSFGVTSNSPINLNYTTLVDLLEDSHRTWKTYAEDYPTDMSLPEWNANGCYMGEAYPSDTKLYRRKHNPFISFTTITNDAARCANIVNAQSNFESDLESGNLPDYSFFIPNIPHSGHDDMNIANQWLEEYMYPLMQNANVDTQNILFVLWFDESNPNGTPEEIADNLIYTVFYGPMVKKTTIHDNYNFYNMLRTLEDIWQLGTLNRNDATASPITPVVWVR